jgi:PhnB protein
MHPWINFNGNAEEAFTFYQSIFGGEISKIIRFKEIASPELRMPGDDAEKIMLVTLSIKPGVALLGNDVPSFMGTTNERENRSKIFLSAQSEEEAEALFAGLSAGGEVEVPLSDSAWGTYFGMFRDKYGIEWVVEYKAA